MAKYLNFWRDSKSATAEESDASENRALKRAVVFSLAVHIVFFILSWLGAFERSDWHNEEWSMDVELSTDFDVSHAKESVLPDAKIAEEAAVHKQILPQLPQRFQVDTKAPEEADALKELEQQKPVEQPSPENTKPSEPAPVLPKPDEEATKIKAMEVLKRKALEQLRLEQKFSDSVQAQKSEALAKLKNDAAEDSSNNMNDSMISGIARDRYRQVVHQAILPHYQLPDAYNLSNKELVSVTEIEIDRAGNVVRAAVHESSGDTVFDQLVIDIVRKASPLPKPPIGFDGKFLMRFSPGSLK